MTRRTLLYRTLLADAATCAAMGLFLVLAGAPIAGLTDLPPALVREAGLLLLPFALFVLWASRREGGWPARTVAIANLAWVAASLALLAGPWIAPNLLGACLIAVQTIAVAGFAALQFHALGEAPPAAA